MGISLCLPYASYIIVKLMHSILGLLSLSYAHALVSTISSSAWFPIA